MLETLRWLFTGIMFIGIVFFFVLLAKGTNR